MIAVPRPGARQPAWVAAAEASKWRRAEFKRLYELCGLTQAQFAAASGISESAIDRLVHGRAEVSLTKVNAARWVCHLLGKPLQIDGAELRRLLGSRR